MSILDVVVGAIVALYFHFINTIKTLKGYLFASMPTKPCHRLLGHHYSLDHHTIKSPIEDAKVVVSIFPTP